MRNDKTYFYINVESEKDVWRNAFRTSIRVYSTIILFYYRGKKYESVLFSRDVGY